MRAHLFGLTPRLVFAPAVLKVTDLLLLLRVHRDHWLPGALILCHRRSDVPELCVTVGMLRAFAGLARGLQAVVKLRQQIAHGALADLMALSIKLLGQSGCALAGPAQCGLRIPSRRRFN